ncbi:MAG: hypothetical protein IJT29_03665 [Oscillospiraceae bacterium]|nr:hypothetical protein [Oscillospiraceae bacterium]
MEDMETKKPAEEPETGGKEAAPAGAEPADAGQEERQSRPTWEEILRDPEYKSRYDAAVQGVVKARLRGRADAEERLARLAPVLTALTEVYGMTDETDTAALAETLRDSVPRRRPGAAEIGEHLQALFAEAESLRDTVPDFDLLRELEDPALLRMTAPGSGISLADAYYARHRAEREEAAARRSLEAVSRSLQTRGARPRELRETTPGARFSQNPAAMTRREREALKKRILEARAEGRSLRPGE